MIVTVKKSEPLSGMISWYIMEQGFKKHREISQPEDKSWDNIR